MIRINLLPTKAAKKKETVLFQLVIGGVVVLAAVLVCLVLNRNMQVRIDNEKQAVADLQNKIKQLEGVIKQVEDFKQKQRDLNQKIATIKKLNDQRSGPVKLLEEFTYTVPRKAWVVSYREANKQLQMEGIAVDGATVADFVDNLRASRYFQDVQLIQVQASDFGGRKVQRFNVNCRVDYTPAGKV